VSAPGTLIARVRALPPRRFDALLAALLFAEGTFEVLAFTTVGGARLALLLGMFAVMATALAFRRRIPVLTIALVLPVMLIVEDYGKDVEEHIAGPFFWLLLVSYSLGAYTEGRRLVFGLVLGSFLILVSVSVDTYHDTVADYLNSVVLAVWAPALFGQVMRNRARLNLALRSKAERLAREREQAAEAAALDERTRIAGELHDVVAHALSAMTVQASAARRMTERQPAMAEAAFLTVEATGREALTELRRLLGVLRREDEEIALAPQPSLAHVAALARRSQTAGLPVELTIEGEPRPLPAGVDLTAYRLVQEALTRARDGGQAGRAAVTVRYAPGEVRVEVVDDGEPSGRRLLGLRERVAVYGGEVQAAPADTNGWRVAARLPAGAAA